MFDIGWQELLLILAIVLLLFGAKRLPEIARSMGQGVREFRKAARSFMEEDDDIHASSDDRALPSVSSTSSEATISPRQSSVIDPAGKDGGERN